jgi:hypothetical protein
MPPHVRSQACILLDREHAPAPTNERRAARTAHHKDVGGVPLGNKLRPTTGACRIGLGPVEEPTVDVQPPLRKERYCTGASNEASDVPDGTQSRTGLSRARDARTEAQQNA